MSFDRSLLPEPLSYYESEGLHWVGRQSSNWRTTSCVFHGGSDSMRVNIKNGAFKCMNCLVGGGDVLSYHMQTHGLRFIDAAKALGAWIDDGKPPSQSRPSALSARDALTVLKTETSLLIIAASQVTQGVALSDSDLARVLRAANLISIVAEEYQS